MLTIIDYGVGNLRSVYMAFRRLGVEAVVSGNAADIARATAVVLPGVGAFGDSAENLRALHLEEPILAAIRDDLPFLGICVGLQLLFEVSEELGEHRGLGVIPGRVKRFDSSLVVPHMGWNQIHQRQPATIWQGLSDDSYAYFVHSYYGEPEDTSWVAGATDYGVAFCSAVAKGNLFAIQFHPEKSQDTGEVILRNFLRLAGIPAAEAAS